MSQLVTKQVTDLAISTAKIAADAVTDAKVRLGNNLSLRARNAANSADVNLIKLDGSDIPQLQGAWQSANTPTLANHVANKAYVDSVAAPENRNKQSITLVAGDITNQYIDLAQPIKASSLDFMFAGLIYNETVDYTILLTGGVAGVTRVTFAGDLATAGASALVATDVVYVKYEY